MTIEKKIRAFAGSVVLISQLLGYFVHPAFYLLTLFVGANLLQSAFTGFCPLETLLGKLEPANHR